MNHPNDFEDLEEIRRIETLLSYNVFDTPPEEEFDKLVQLISLICDMPIALISVLNDKKQYFKARIGFEAPEGPRKESFCQYAIGQNEIMEIRDALRDQRTSDLPMVKEDHGIRFYAGMPLEAENGYKIGTLCVLDRKPRKLTKKQKKALKLLANQIMIVLEARRKNRRLVEGLEDVLEKKISKTQRELLQKQVEYNFLLKAIKKSNGVIEFSPDGIIQAVNKNFLKFVGFEKEELLGRHHSILLDEEQKQTNPEFWKSLQEGNFKSGRLRRKHKDGSEVWLQATYNPILNLEDKVTKVIKIAQDITAEIRAERAVREAKELAESLNIQKDNFIANVSHEIRTPIHAVLGFTELLLEQENDELKHSYLKSVKTAGDNLLFIINDILDLSKIEAGMIQMEQEAFELDKTVKNVFSILQLKAHQKKIGFSYKIESEVPLSLTGDKNRLSQVLINLLGNAIKFTSQGKVELRISVKKRAHDLAIFQFRVSDTGIGIPADKLDFIFQRFSQAEENTSRTYGGTGLGLNISKQLIEKQNGSIEVKSKPGEGSVFIFALPFRISTETPEKAPVIRKKKTLKDVKGRILLCEDNELNQRLIKAILNGKGYETDLAENGEKGIAFVKQNNYDLIFMDLQMPIRDGYQATEAIRNELRSAVPVIALTANFMLLEKEKCLRMGMNDYLSKPFTKEELLEKTAFWLEQEKRYKPSVPPAGIFKNRNAKLSFENLEELSGGNKEFEEEMIRLFIRQSEKALQEMQQQLKDRDLEAIKIAAHKLKTSFGIIGADPVYLNRLEGGAPKDSFDEPVEDTLNALKKQLTKIFFILNQKIN